MPPPNLPNKLDPDYEKVLLDKTVDLVIVELLNRFNYQVKILSTLCNLIKWTSLIGGGIYLAIKNRSLLQW